MRIELYQIAFLREFISNFISKGISYSFDDKVLQVKGENIIEALQKTLLVVYTLIGKNNLLKVKDEKDVQILIQELCDYHESIMRPILLKKKLKLYRSFQI